MVDEARVQQLVNELLDSNATPEAVCALCPDLLPEVRRRWRQISRIRSDLDAMFPPLDETIAEQDDRPHLPPIPGYDVEAVLGRGGMGIVLRARHVRLNRLVALKFPQFGPYAARHERERFQRETEAVAKLHHPNVVQIYDVGEIDGQPYFTMELMEGGSLAKKVAGIPQPARSAAELLATIAGAVEAAHQSGIIHRDIKPSNVLLADEGTPKISDFGLARRLDDGPGITRTGTPIGTPSYMAPEQAQGQSAALGLAVDVYALGAILYELLTGRPPFRAATAAETIQQVISQEPVPPSRLNNQVPRDLETICLKCLHKDPQRRYASAAALTDDLRRFVEGRPILARPVGVLERTWRWIRRNPTATALLATAMAFVALASGSAVWIIQQRAKHELDLRNGVSAALPQAASLRQRYHFRQARELLEFAEQRLGPAGPKDLRRQVNNALADLDLVENLDKARLQAATLVEGRFEPFAAEPLYEEAFAKAGLGRPGDDPEAVAAQVRGSTLSAEIVAALDDWANITGHKTRRAWLLEVARRADPDSLRDRLRQPELWGGDPALAALVRELNVDDLSPQLATALGRVLIRSGQDALPLLSAAQGRFPQDFWLNFYLGYALRRAQNWDEALSYCRAALALRPEVAAVNNDLGLVLSKKGRRNEAIRYFREAVRLDSKFALAHNNLGAALSENGQPDEGISHYEQAVRLDPKLGMVHTNLGTALLNQGKLDRAISHLQEAVRLDPKLAGPHNYLGNALRQRGRLDDALGQLEEAVRLDQKWGEAHVNLGVVLVLKGRPDDAIGHFEEAIRIDPKVATLAHSNLGIVLRDQGRLDEAIDHFREAVRLNPNSAQAHNNLGIVLRRMDRQDEAIDHLQEAVRLDPNAVAAHMNLGAALVRKKRLQDALSHYEQAVRLDPKLVPARFSLALVLQDAGRLDEAIGHFQEVVRLAPNLADARRCLFTCRYAAACAAVRAAHDENARQPPSGEAARAELRRRALEWLRADIVLTTELLKDGKAADCWPSAWQTDPALVSVRESAELAKLPDAEREQWKRLWSDVTKFVDSDPAAQGRVFAARRDWTRATECYARAVKLGGTDDGHFWFEYAAVLLLNGDRTGHAQTCAHMIERHAKAGGPRGYHVARACTLAPDSVADVARPGRLAEKELQDSAQQFWSLTEQGALAYRAGRLHESVPLFDQSLRANSRPGTVVVNWLWLALADHRLGKTEQARRWLEKAQTWLDQFKDGMPPDADEAFGLHLHNWLEAHVLRREAEALIRHNTAEIGSANRESDSPPK